MLSKRVSLSEQIQHTLHERIINNVYPKGEYLPSEAGLCEEFGVSRTTVRDAISALAQKGFVKRQQGKGILVINNTDSVVTNSLKNMMLLGDYTVEEFLETREMIERQMAYFAARRATEEQIADMQKAIDCMESHTDDIEAYVGYDLEFHKQIALASQNKLLITVYDAFLPMLQQMVESVVRSSGTVEAEAGYHSKILECIRNRDSAGAQKRTSEHDKCSEEMFRSNIANKDKLDRVIVTGEL